MERIKSLYLVMMLFLTIVLNAESAVTVNERQVSDVEGNTRITVKNEYFEIELVPLGAQAVSFKTRYGDRQWLWSGSKGIYDSGHLFMDNFLGQDSPAGELCFIKHTYEILKRGPDVVEIKFQAPTKEKLRLEKTFIFSSGSPAVRVKLVLRNESKDVITHFWCAAFLARAVQLRY